MRMRLGTCGFVCALVFAAVPASAQPSPACKPVIDAMHKQWTTPNHVTVLQRGRTEPIEEITVGNEMYVKSGTRWIKSPESAADYRQGEEAKLKNAKTYTCQALTGASVNGVSAAMFAIHTEDAETTSDSQFWIARATGLPIKVETDMTVAGDKSHFSSTWDYTNIHAPVVK